MTRDEVMGRLCRLMGEVADALNHAPHGPTDCFCEQGGFWESPAYARNPDRYQNDGVCVAWMEEAVREKIATLSQQGELHA